MSEKINEMGMAAGSGFQAPIGVEPLPAGARNHKDKIDKCLSDSGDLNEAHALVFFRNASPKQIAELYVALDFNRYERAADMIREQFVRQLVRKKISEVVRKKAGGGGYTLYAPNKGKKHGSKPVATFPTRLAAKRAELARFPPKDPKKLQRLRKEIEKLLKDPKKRAEAERRAMKTRGTDVTHHAGKARGKYRESLERKVIARIITNEIYTKSRIQSNRLTEALFKEEMPASPWDEFIKKISVATLKNDQGYQRIVRAFDNELQNTFDKAMKLISKSFKQRGASVKYLGTKTKGTDVYVGFEIKTEKANMGPIFIHAQNGVPTIEWSDKAEAKMIESGGLEEIAGVLKSIELQLRNMGDLRGMIGKRDQYLSKIEAEVDKILSSMSALQLAMIKRLLVKKYRGKRQ